MAKLSQWALKDMMVESYEEEYIGYLSASPDLEFQKEAEMISIQAQVDLLMQMADMGLTGTINFNSLDAGTKKELCRMLNIDPARYREISMEMIKAIRQMKDL